jgi:hypothetical protein
MRIGQYIDFIFLFHVQDLKNLVSEDLKRLKKRQQKDGSVGMWQHSYSKYAPRPIFTLVHRCQTVF